MNVLCPGEEARSIDNRGGPHFPNILVLGQHLLNLALSWAAARSTPRVSQAFDAVGDGRSALYGRVPANAEIGCRFVDAVADASDASPVPKLKLCFLNSD